MRAAAAAGGEGIVAEPPIPGWKRPEDDWPPPMQGEHLILGRLGRFGRHPPRAKRILIAY